MNDPQTKTASASSSQATAIARSHFLYGWWSLLLFVMLGIGLESLHVFKVGWYVDRGEPETRRLMWTLAHSHGTVLALVNIALAATLSIIPTGEQRLQTLASRCLFSASILLPAAFFLGGAFVSGGDPGMGILLTVPGALLLLIAVFAAARTCRPAAND